MTNMKKIFATVMATAMLASMSVGAFADGNHISKVEPVSVVAIREDVPLNEALQDKTFSTAASKQATKRSGGAYWDFYGERQWMDEGSEWGAKPYGWSAQINSDTGKVENTYHYTNVYFKYFGSMKGASGRIWGHGKVEATGKFCIQDVVDLSVVTVKYGVSND